jgi:futalosine hydrolase
LVYGYLQMHLLLLSATRFEISDMADWLINRPELDNILNTELLISGIGQLQTAYALQKKIQSGRPDLVIQAGIGGSSSPQDIGKVYAIRSERIADLGVMEETGFRDIFDMGLEEPGKFPFFEGKLINPYKQFLDWTGLTQRDGITVNEIKSAGSPVFKRIDLPVVESMEGAALHFVCLQEKLPFIQIRSVSNILGERDKGRWKLKEAMDILHLTLESLIKKLEKSNETLFRI